MRREFQFIEGTSSKFWAIELDGASFTVQYGKIGTAGQAQTKSFGSDAEALKNYQKLVLEKTGKGYQEVGGGASPTQPPAAKAAAPPTPPPATPRTASSLPAPPAATPQVASSLPASTATPPPKAETLPASTAAPPPNAEAQPAPPVATAPKAETSSAPKVQPAPGSIDLAPEDRFWKTAPRPPALERPSHLPFDLETCRQRLRDGLAKANLSPGMSFEEASFWLVAAGKINQGAEPSSVADEVNHPKLPTGWTAAEANEALGAKETLWWDRPNQLLLILGRLLDPLDLVELLLPKQSRTTTLHAIRQFALPYWTQGDAERIRPRLEAEMAKTLWPMNDYYQTAPMVFHLAAMVGCHVTLSKLVASWPDRFYRDSSWDHTHYHTPQPVVLGLGDPDRIVAEFRRLRMSLNKPEYVTGWLATTALEQLDFLRESTRGVASAPDAEPLVAAFAVARSPEVARHMLDLKLNSKAPKIASKWLEANEAQAVLGLLETANSGRGRLAESAIDFLRKARRKGYEPMLREALRAHPMERVQREVLDWEEPSYATFDVQTSPDWLKDAPPAGKLPTWLDPADMPLLVVGTHRLSAEQVRQLLTCLSKASLDAPPPLLVELRRQASESSRNAFVWALMEGWLGEGAPSKERWTMGASGFLGGDEIALKLTPLIRKWPGESQHQRAVFGLECLQGIGTDTALMCLNGMAQKLEFKALKAKAAECVEAIAAQRNMTRAELEDRIVPDCDLDERGTRVFDYGPRQFRFVLGEGMKAMVRDGDNKLKPDLPAPNAKDDTDLSKSSLEAWKLLKKQIKDVARIQAERLEQAMVTGRSWKVTDFQALLVNHPLMINLVRLLVWGCYDGEGRLQFTFRIDEERQPADPNDNPISLTNESVVRLVHSLHLPDDTRAAWGTVFSDYQLISPFPQLGRACNELTEAERDATEITRFKDLKIPAVSLVGTFERLGWARGIPQDGGVFFEHSKPFYGAGVTAVAIYDGVPVGYMVDWDDQHIEKCFFVPGIYAPEGYPEHKNALKLGDVAPVAVSETLADLQALAQKAR